MIRLTPVLKDYIWGGERLKELFGRRKEGKIAESWEISVHPDGVSGCPSGSFAEYLRRNPAAAGGGEFPVLIKYIDAAQNLSVQVHPDDAYARGHEGDNGKTEMWYIVRAEQGAGIYCGFRRDVSKEEFLQKTADGTVEELLNFIPVKAGDCFLIKAGTVHAICAGCVICEVQQSSNVTYRIYDYKRKGADGKERPLHLEKAADVINFRRFEDETNSGSFRTVEGGRLRLLTQCPYFRCRELLLSGAFREERRSFVAVNVLEGEGTIGGMRFAAGDSFFVPAGEAYCAEGEAKLLLTDLPPKRYYAGIDLGGTYVKCGITDGAGNLLIKDKIATGRERAPEAIAEDIAACVKGLAKRLGVTLDGAGIGSPGLIDGERGVVVYSNNLGWKDVPLCALLESRLGVPVRATNDANAAALGECRCGAGKPYRYAVLVTLGTGVGSGIVLDGSLYEGKAGAGAEIGHTVLRLGGERCTCGRRGCFEAYASATALIRQTKRAMLRHTDSAMWELCRGNADNADGKTAFDGMRAGDRAAKRVVNAYIRYLAEGVANIANVFRPDAIILGGGICAEGETLLKPLRKYLDKLVMGGNAYATVELKTASLGNDAGLCGAAQLAVPADAR